MPVSSPAVGDHAPDFALPDQHGSTVRLADLLAQDGGRVVVLYFYPKDDTPGCTAQGCAFRDAYEDFVEAGATVVGVSKDSPQSHAAFAAKRRLPFVLLSDPDNTVRRAYGATGPMGLIPGRVTFVIGPDGVVRSRFASQINMTKHVRTALDVVRELARRP